MQEFLMEHLECPQCHGELIWHVKERQGEHIESGEAVCENCQEIYPISEGIGSFLTPDLPRNDLWEQAESGIATYLRENPEIEEKLMNSPLDSLSPADCIFRSMILDERGLYEDARQTERFGEAKLYHRDFLACHQRQYDYVIEKVASNNGLIVDLACGRLNLVEQVLEQTEKNVVATDFSPFVMRRNRRYLEMKGLYQRTSLLVFDARRTPFKDGTVDLLTTNLGLPNIEEPAALAAELRRVVSGTLLAISHLFSEDDQANAAVLKKYNVEIYSYRRSAQQQLMAAGWGKVDFANSCTGKAISPSEGVLIPAMIDVLPAADTELDWCVIHAE